MRLLSSIIKGRRIRSESKLQIENKNKYVAPEKGDEDLIGEQPKEAAQKEDVKIRIKEIKYKADTIIEDAKIEGQNQADLIIFQGREKAEQEAVVITEKARDDGYSKGYARGEQEAQALVEEAKKVIQDAQEEKQQILKEAEPEVIEMIIGICGKLISEEINFNKDTILILVRKALKEVSSDMSDSEISIKVSPDEYDYVLDNKDSIMKSVSNPENIKILNDINLDKGVCIVETAFGSVKCNVEESFSEIKKQMRLISNKK